MPRRSRPTSEPDLFSLKPAAPRPLPPAELQAAILPDVKPAISIDDLGRMIAGWSDAEVEQLRVMVTNEIQRRGFLPAEPMHASPSAAEVERAAGETVRQRKREDSVQEVAPGQVSAIRAASQAGMALGKIAREFGLPLATIKRILDISASF
jgi:LysM repeat protein